jgi:hypothetical protein
MTHMMKPIGIRRLFLSSTRFSTRIGERQTHIHMKDMLLFIPEAHPCCIFPEKAARSLGAFEKGIASQRYFNDPKRHWWKKKYGIRVSFSLHLRQIFTLVLHFYNGY